MSAIKDVLKRPTQTFTLPGGSVLQYAIYGDTTALTKTCFYHHGLPGCHLEAAIYDAPARELGLRIISISRPGMAQSSPQPQFRVLDWPAQLLALADHLQASRFTVLGVSGGAPYTLACMYALPADRCIGAGTVAGVYPASLGWAGMALDTRLVFNMAAWSPWLVEKTLESLFGGLARDKEHPEKLEEYFANMFKSRIAVERQVWEDNEAGVRDVLVEDTRAALEKGCKSAAWEFYLAATTWGFEIDSIKLAEGGRRLVMWHGGIDANWPVAMARKTSMRVAGSELRVSETEAHVSIFARTTDEVIATMAEMMD